MMWKRSEYGHVMSPVCVRSRAMLAALLRSAKLLERQDGKLQSVDSADDLLLSKARVIKDRKQV